jgi:GNAT superfamily N-acetyltransferase
MSFELERCALVEPRSDADWSAYHDIRRRILFERRGEFGVYDANRPGPQIASCICGTPAIHGGRERAPGHYAKLLVRASTYLGVVRIDVEGTTAYLRRVAIDEPYQRQGLGRILLALAEAFARAQSATRVESSVARDAVPFYLKCGYRLVGVEEADAPHPQMCKELRS